MIAAVRHRTRAGTRIARTLAASFNVRPGSGRLSRLRLAQCAQTARERRLRFSAAQAIADNAVESPAAA